jgi:Domain of unknown function (DUF4402)
MMNGAQFHFLKPTGVVGAIMAAALIAGPAYADTKPGSAEITIVRPLSFVIDDGLDFGNVIRGTTAGTVTVAPNGTRTSTGGVTLANNGGHKAASFAGQGTLNQRVDISIGANSIFITGPGAPMRVRTFVIGSTPTAPLTTAPTRFTIAAASGIFSFPVGATLEVGANQVPGKYSGTWSITLNYF